MSEETIFSIPYKEFETIEEDPRGLEPLVTYMRRVHPDLARTVDGKGIIIHKRKLPKNLILDGNDFENLEYLNLAESSFDKITFKGSFSNLEYIDLSQCELKDIDFGLKPFPKLKQLYLRKNQLSKLHITVDMPALELLDAGENPLLQEIRLDTELPALKYLYFYKKKEEKDDEKVNKPINYFSFQSMPTLKVLDLENGGLEKLPDNFLSLKGLETLYLSGSRPEGVPEAVIGVGDRKDSAQTVLAYLKSLEGKKADELVYWRQSKLFFIGNGKVGKTSLKRRLMDRKAEMVKEDDRTNTIEVISWSFSLSSKEYGLKEDIDYQFSVWDFGGQDRYREIQQMFFSPRSIYVYVTFHKDKSQGDYVGYEYWLSLARGYGYDEEIQKPSPVFHVVNKIDEKDEWTNEVSIKKEFENTKRFLKVSAKKLLGLNELEESIKNSIKDISDDIFDDKFNPDWMLVKEKLEESSKKYITIREYLEDFCMLKSKEGEPIRQLIDENTAREWLKVLRRKGTVLYFGDSKTGMDSNDPILKNLIIIKPEWIREAMTKALDYALKREGKLVEADFGEIWKESEYDKDKVEMFKSLLLVHKMMFKTTSKAGRVYYIFPSTLSREALPLPEKLRADADYVIKFEFNPFVPPGTVSKLVVGLYKSIYDEFYWRKNVILYDEKNQTFAHVKEDWENKAVFVSFFGKKPHALLEMIRSELQRNIEELKSMQQIKELNFNVLVEDNETWLKKEAALRYNPERFRCLWEDCESLKERSEPFIPILWDVNQDGALKIALFGAEPLGESKLDINLEFQKIPKSTFQVVIEETNVKLIQMKTEIDENSPHVIHFSGHSYEDADLDSKIWKELSLKEFGMPEPLEGLVLLANSGRGSDIWSTDDMVDFFSRLEVKKQPILIVLNICSSMNIAKRISELGLYVVGTTQKVKNKAAQDFAEAFYYVLKSKTSLDGNKLRTVLNRALLTIDKEYENIFSLFFNGVQLKLKKNE